MRAWAQAPVNLNGFQLIGYQYTSASSEIVGKCFRQNINLRDIIEFIAERSRSNVDSVILNQREKILCRGTSTIYVNLQSRFKLRTAQENEGNVYVYYYKFLESIEIWENAIVCRFICWNKKWLAFVTSLEPDLCSLTRLYTARWPKPDSILIPLKLIMDSTKKMECGLFYLRNSAGYGLILLMKYV